MSLILSKLIRHELPSSLVVSVQSYTIATTATSHVFEAVFRARLLSKQLEEEHHGHDLPYQFRRDTAQDGSAALLDHYLPDPFRDITNFRMQRFAF